MTTRARDRVRPPRWQRLARLVEAAPAALLTVTGSTALVGVAAAWLDVRPLSSVVASRILVLALVIVAVGTLVVTTRTEGRTGSGLLPTVPGLVLVAYALVMRTLPLGDRAEWFLGGDHVRHLLFVAEEQARGNLDYGSQPYPRAWHTVITTLWSASGGHLDGEGLRSLVDLMSTTAWCLPAVLSIATGRLTVATAQRCGAPQRRAEVAGLGAAAAMMLPPFLGTYQTLGFENSYVGAIVLAVVTREVLTVGNGSRSWAIALTLVGGVVCAHSWQLLLPGCAVAGAWLAWPVLRRGSWKGRTGLALGSVLCAVVALPALLAVFTVIGIQHATDSGVEAPFPLLLLVAGLAAAVALPLRRRSEHSILILLAVVLLPAITALYVAVRVGIPLTDYYPSKLLWHSAVLGLTPISVVGVPAWGWLGQRVSSAAVRVTRGSAGVLGALLLAFSLVSPTAALVGAWSTVRGPLVLDAITAQGASRAQVVWLDTVGDDTIGRILLDFYRVQATPERTPQSPLGVAEECALLSSAPRPAVLSNRSAWDVRMRYSCVPDVTAIPSHRR